MTIYSFSETQSIFFYFLVFLFSMVFAHLASKDDNKVFWFITFFIITIPVAIRFDTGKDWRAYENAYRIIKESSDFINAPFNIELSYKVLAFLSNYFTNSSLLLFSFYAILTNYFALKGILSFKKYINPKWALFTYMALFYFYQYNISRQFLSVMIIFAAYKYIVEKNFLKYLFYVLLASFFHQTALICIFLYTLGLFSDRKNKSRILINMVLGIFSFVFIIGVDQWLNFAKVLVGSSKFEIYTVGEISIRFGLLLQLIMCFIVIFGYINNNCSLNNYFPLATFSYRLLFLASMSYSLQYLLVNYGGRLYLYFVPIEIILIGAILKKGIFRSNYENKAANLYYVFIFLFLLAQFAYSLAINSQSHIPYSFRLPM